MAGSQCGLGLNGALTGLDDPLPTLGPRLMAEKLDHFFDRYTDPEYSI